MNRHICWHISFICICAHSCGTEREISPVTIMLHSHCLLLPSFTVKNREKNRNKQCTVAYVYEKKTAIKKDHLHFEPKVSCDKLTAWESIACFVFFFMWTSSFIRFIDCSWIFFHDKMSVKFLQLLLGEAKQVWPSTTQVWTDANVISVIYVLWCTPTDVIRGFPPLSMHIWLSVSLEYWVVIWLITSALKYGCDHTVYFTEH